MLKIRDNEIESLKKEILRDRETMLKIINDDTSNISQHLLKLTSNLNEEIRELRDKKSAFDQLMLKLGETVMGIRKLVEGKEKKEDDSFLLESNYSDF